MGSRVSAQLRVESLRLIGSTAVAGRWLKLTQYCLTLTLHFL